MAKKIKTTADLTPDADNANMGTPRGAYMVRESLKKYGAGRSILVDRDGNVIAGNKTLEAAEEAEYPIRVIQTDGKELVVVQRTDLDLSSDPTARELAYVDNRASEVGLEWDPAQISRDFDAGVDFSSFFFEDELQQYLSGVEDDEGEVGEDGVRVDEGKALQLLASVFTPKHECADGQVWAIGRHRLVVCGVVYDTPTWLPILVEAGDDALFAPFPGPKVGLSKLVASNALVMVQPDALMADAVLQSLEAVLGERATRVS